MLPDEGASCGDPGEDVTGTVSLHMLLRGLVELCFPSWQVMNSSMRSVTLMTSCSPTPRSRATRRMSSGETVRRFRYRPTGNVEDHRCNDEGEYRQ